MLHWQAENPRRAAPRVVLSAAFRAAEPPMDPTPHFQQFGISLLLGLLVGLQRQRTDSELAGIRTFPLITIFGTLCAVLAQTLHAPWIPAAGILGLVGMLAASNLSRIGSGKTVSGLTTEVAVLVMFAVGAFLVVGPWSVAVAVGCGVAILLQLKPQMHGFAARLGEEDFRAIIQFLLVTFIVLPVVPNQAYNPLEPLATLFPRLGDEAFRVLNPHEIWLMVVLVVSISLGGYVAYKLFGHRAGVVTGGMLGGTISSTATTVSYSRQAADAPSTAGLACVAIMIATTVTYLRVLLEISVVSPTFLPIALPPLAIMGGVSCLLVVATWLVAGRGESEMPPQGNPTQLKSAVMFGLAYAVVSLAVAVGRVVLPQEGLYLIAALSGMTDMDAITLSTSRYVQSGRIDASVGWRLVVLATMSNLVFKGIIVATTGHRRLFVPIALMFGVSLAVGAALIFFWK